METILIEIAKPFIQEIVAYLLKYTKDVNMIIVIICMVISTIIFIRQKQNYEKYIKSLWYDLYKYEELCKKITESIPQLEISAKNLVNEYNTLKELVKEKDYHIKFLKKYGRK